MLRKRVINQTKLEPVEFMSHIIVKQKIDGGLKLISNLKFLNKSVAYSKLKLYKISSVLHLGNHDTWQNEYRIYHR